jgi:V-type H+-transporting ATPase proteolipid subunit
MGAAYGTSKSGVHVASMGAMRPELVMKSIVPVVMATVLGIYGLIIAVIISTGINPKVNLFDGYAHLSSGLACGLVGLAGAMTIGIVGDAGVRYHYSFCHLHFLSDQGWYPSSRGFSLSHCEAASW